jgi:hypothetical protein
MKLIKNNVEYSHEELKNININVEDFQQTLKQEMIHQMVQHILDNNIIDIIETVDRKKKITEFEARMFIIDEKVHNDVMSYLLDTLKPDQFDHVLKLMRLKKK